MNKKKYNEKILDKYQHEAFDVLVGKLHSKLITRMLRDYLTSDAAKVYNYQFENIGYYEWMLKTFSQKDLFIN